jgi:hypothetical protein
MRSFDFVSMALSPLVLADDSLIVAATVGMAAAAHCDDRHKKSFPPEPAGGMEALKTCSEGLSVAVVQAR